MQKVINVIALLSGLTSLGMIGGGAYLYTQKDALVQGAVDKVTDCLLYTSPSPRDYAASRMPSSA